MRLGIFAKTFAGSDPLTVLTAARDAGYACVQYNMACSGLPAMPDHIPDDAAQAVAEASRATGVAIAAVSGTWNMIHPDPDVRETGFRRFAELVRTAPLMGAPMITLCTGTRDPDDQWRHHPGNADPSAWSDLRAMLDRACALAEPAGLRLGIEPELANVVDSAAAARRLLDETGSPALAIVLDPANLAEVAAPDDRRRIIEQAVDLLADRTVMAHAKDRHADGSFATAGQGVVDFPQFLGSLRAAGFDGDLVTHGLRDAEAPGVARFLSALT